MKMKLMITFLIDLGSILDRFWKHFGSILGAFLSLSKHIYLKSALDGVLDALGSILGSILGLSEALLRTGEFPKRV